MHLLSSTIALRPYVFVFLLSFLCIAVVNFGLSTTLLFIALTYGVGLSCEYSSVHNGFPFSLYHYVGATQGKEIWVLGVPLFDSISYTFLAFASYTLALLLCSPLYCRRWDLRVLDTWAIRRSPRVWLMAAFLMVMLDMVVDPLSVLGKRWFLGTIFWYDQPGPYFGVPISNFLGWYGVAAISVAIFQALDFRLNRRGKPFGVLPALPWRGLLGPMLYAGIVTFGITMLFIIHAAEIAWTGLFIFMPLVVMVLHTVTRSECYGDHGAIADHLADFPFNQEIFESVPASNECVCGW
jgi:uncharacterized membrane protein